MLAMYCQSTVAPGPVSDGQFTRASAAAPWGNR